MILGRDKVILQEIWNNRVGCGKWNRKTLRDHHIFFIDGLSFFIFRADPSFEILGDASTYD